MSVRALFLFVWSPLLCYFFVISRAGKQSRCRTMWSMISQSSRRGHLSGFTKAGLTTKGTKNPSITYSSLDHWWDTKLGSMKPATKDWSSEHQSPWCKSSLFQTSGLLIQTTLRGELLVRNQYASWGVLWPTLHKDTSSLKSISSWEGWKVEVYTPFSTDWAGGDLMQLSKVQNRFITPVLHSRTLTTFTQKCF